MSRNRNAPRARGRNVGGAFGGGRSEKVENDRSSDENDGNKGEGMNADRNKFWRERSRSREPDHRNHQKYGRKEMELSEIEQNFPDSGGEWNECFPRNSHGEHVNSEGCRGGYGSENGAQHRDWECKIFTCPYADPIIDSDNGKIAPDRLHSAFIHVAKATGTTLVLTPSGADSFSFDEAMNFMHKRGDANKSPSRSHDTKPRTTDFAPAESTNKRGNVSNSNAALGNLSECSEVSDGSDDDSVEDGEVLDASSAEKLAAAKKSEALGNSTVKLPRPEMLIPDSAASKTSANTVKALVSDPRLRMRQKTQPKGPEPSPVTVDEYSGVDCLPSTKSQMSKNWSNPTLFRDFVFHPVVAPDSNVLPSAVAKSCIAKGKLPLILDLDNTLLNAQAMNTVSSSLDLEDWVDERGLPMLYKFELPCNRKTYYLKLRPFVREFLSYLDPYFEMSVYTNATQEYADLVLAILDPERTLFEDRIVARTSNQRSEASELKSVSKLYGALDRRGIVAFDDRVQIWTDLPYGHVVKAQHYDFFDSNKAELNAYYSLDDIERGNRKIAKPRDYDRHLEFMIKVFLKIHHDFFLNPAANSVASIVEAMQRAILSKVGVFLTGYRKTFFASVAMCDLEERQSELAIKLGAKIHKKFDETGVTHVVAGKNNTNNMLACKDEKYRHLAKVHTLWLYACEGMWTNAPAEPFDADVVCAFYDNSPPTLHYRDHWIHLAKFYPLPEIVTGKFESKMDKIPVREFLATGPYSDGATLTSPSEDIVFLWIPSKQKYRQVLGDEHSNDFTDTLHVSMGSQPSSASRTSPDRSTSPPEHGGGSTTAETGADDGESLPFCNNRVYG